MQNFFIVVHSGYQSTTIAIFSNNTNQAHIIEKKKVTNQQASKLLIPIIKTLLQDHGYKLTNTQFIAAYRGPAPFTSLRTGLTTVQGLAYAAKIPLIGLDGLQIFAHEVQETSPTDFSLIALNAFCNDVYYALYNKKTGTTITGWGQSEKIYMDLAQDVPKTSHIVIAGNVIEQHKALLSKAFAQNVTTYSNQTECTLEALAKKALVQWEEQKTITHEIAPLYLKPHSAQHKR